MNHPLPVSNGSLERKFVAKQIATLRREWQESVGEGVNLDDIKSSVGLILEDISNSLGLTTGEILEAMSQ